MKFFRTSALCVLCSLPALGIASAFAADSAKDPADWYKQDTSPRAQYETAKREAAGAYKEALSACRALHGAEKKTCTKEARDTYSEELADAKRILKNNS